MLMLWKEAQIHKTVRMKPFTTINMWKGIKNVSLNALPTVTMAALHRNLQTSYARQNRALIIFCHWQKQKQGWHISTHNMCFGIRNTEKLSRFDRIWQYFTILVSFAFCQLKKSKLKSSLRLNWSDNEHEQKQINNTNNSRQALEDSFFQC